MIDRLKYWLNLLLSKSLWINLLLMGVASVVMVFLILIGLKVYTDHGAAVKVPNLRGMNVEEVNDYVRENGFEATVYDSTYVVGKKPLEVINQDPLPGSMVKQNRRIYLTVNSQTPPQTKLPEILDASLRSARAQLNSRGLLLGNVEEIPGIGRVVKKMKIDGVEMLPGEAVSKGQLVDLVMTDGLGQRTINVPYLVGMTYNEAIAALQLNQLNVGALVRDADVQDLNAAYVFQQKPAALPGSYSPIRIGGNVDLFLQTDPIFDDLIDSEERLLRQEEQRRDNFDLYQPGTDAPDPNAPDANGYRPFQPAQPESGGNSSNANPFRRK